MTIANIEQQVRWLTDLEELKSLKFNYCHFSDSGWRGAGANVEAFLALFIEDLLWDAGGMQPIHGKQTLREWLLSTIGISIHGAMHLVGNGAIDINGDKAIGRWHGVMPIINHTLPSMVLCGMYEDHFIRTTGGWKIEIMRFYPALGGPLGAALQLLDTPPQGVS